MRLESLHTLYALRDMRDAEDQILKALPKMIERVQHIELRTALERHLAGILVAELTINVDALRRGEREVHRTVEADRSDIDREALLASAGRSSVRRSEVLTIGREMVCRGHSTPAAEALTRCEPAL